MTRNREIISWLADDPCDEDVEMSVQVERKRERGREGVRRMRVGKVGGG
jgi:hypothetical protein